MSDHKSLTGYKEKGELKSLRRSSARNRDVDAILDRLLDGEQIEKKEILQYVLHQATEIEAKIVHDALFYVSDWPEFENIEVAGKVRSVFDSPVGWVKSGKTYLRCAMSMLKDEGFYGSIAPIGLEKNHVQDWCVPQDVFDGIQEGRYDKKVLEVFADEDFLESLEKSLCEMNSARFLWRAAQAKLAEIEESEAAAKKAQRIYKIKSFFRGIFSRFKIKKKHLPAWESTEHIKEANPGLAPACVDCPFRKLVQSPPLAWGGTSWDETLNATEKGYGHKVYTGQAWWTCDHPANGKWTEPQVSAMMPDRDKCPRVLMSKMFFPVRWYWAWKIKRYIKWRQRVLANRI